MNQYERIIKELREREDMLCWEAANAIETLMAMNQMYKNQLEEPKQEEQKEKSLKDEINTALAALENAKAKIKKAEDDKAWDQHMEHMKKNGNGWI